MFIDDIQKGQLAKFNDKPQILNVVAGAHIVEVRTDGTVLWQQYVLVASGDEQTPRHILEEYVEKPQLIREAYIVAAKVVSNALVKHMRQE